MINMIITCSHMECEYNHCGECGKDCIKMNDNECIVMKESKNDNN